MDILKSLNASDLPSPPGIALRLLEIFNNPEVTTEELANVIGADPALTAKIIDYCNSPLLGRTSKTTSLNQAVVMLGMRSVKMIALSFSLIRTEASEENGFDYSAFWNQSLATAIASRSLVEIRSGNGEDAFLVGLMLNIGQMALAHFCLDEFLSLKQESFVQDDLPPNVAIALLERQNWSTDHYAMGSQLLEQWNFPPKIFEALRTYGATLGEPAVTDEFSKTLSLAEQLVSMIFNETYAREDVQKIQAESAKFLRISESQFDQRFDTIVSQWSEYAKLLKFDSVEIRSLKELEDRAKKGITQMMLGMAQEHTMIQQENTQLKSKVMFDELTGLKNRRAYESELATEIERSRRMETPITLMVLDIDHFKSVNDRYGHDGGDATLVAIANCLKSNIRPYDSAFRFGGEEFVLLLANCNEQIAMKIADRIRCQIQSLTISHLQHKIRITTSIGAACATAPQYPTLDVLFKMADSQLYQAKNSGRNRCCVTSTSNVPNPVTIPYCDVNGSTTPIG